MPVLLPKLSEDGLMPNHPSQPRKQHCGICLASDFVSGEGLSAPLTWPHRQPRHQRVLSLLTFAHVRGHEAPDDCIYDGLPVIAVAPSMEAGA